MNFKKNAKLCPEVSSQNCLEVENHRPERLETSRQLLQWWPGKGPKLLKKTEGKVFAPATAKQVLDYISVYLYVQCTPGLMYTYIYLLAHTSMYFLYIYIYMQLGSQKRKYVCYLQSYPGLFVFKNQDKRHTSMPTPGPPEVLVDPFLPLRDLVFKGSSPWRQQKCRCRYRISSGRVGLVGLGHHCDRSQKNEFEVLDVLHLL